MLDRVPVVTRIRIGFAWQGLVTVAAAAYALWWTQTAVDWVWIYRIGFPIAAVSFLWTAWRPRLGRLTEAFIPIAILSVVRVADFLQDWFLTPEPVEQISLWVRLMSGAVGWSYLLGAIWLLDALEELASARIASDPE